MKGREPKKIKVEVPVNWSHWGEFFRYASAVDKVCLKNY